MTTIYKIMADTNGNITVNQTYHKAIFKDSISALCTATLAQRCVLIAMSATEKTLTVYNIASDGTALNQLLQIKTDEKYDFLNPLHIGGKPHVLAYVANTGCMDFYKIEDDALIKIYRYQRTYGLTTTGFTTIKTIKQQGQMFVLGYNQRNGEANIYQLSVTADSPLSVNNIWHAVWAKDWQRFAFFTLGTENFFIKTNINPNSKHITTYIDHVYDNAAKGSHPVAKDLPLAVDLTSLCCFEFDGLVHFMGYRNEDGQATINRLHSNCQSWTELMQTRLIKDAKTAISFTLTDDTFLLLH